MQTLPERIDLIILDFDGVLTDDRVLVDQDGRESVACSRADGLGIAMLRRAGFPLLILSSETNPIVSARARKLQVPALQGLRDKAQTLRQVVAQRGLNLRNVVYVGNDVNDAECLTIVGCGVTPADAHPDAKRVADFVFSRAGGQGVVRELADLILAATASDQLVEAHV